MSSERKLPLALAQRLRRAEPITSTCPRCDRAFRDSEVNCPVCGLYRGAPNVIAASHEAEQSALLVRTKRVMETCPFEEKLAALAQAISSSTAVINVTAAYAHLFIESDSVLYASYETLVLMHGRLPATVEDDQRRSAVGGSLFGSHAQEMRYGALSLDG